MPSRILPHARRRSLLRQHGRIRARPPPRATTLRALISSLSSPRPPAGRPAHLRDRRHPWLRRAAWQSARDHRRRSGAAAVEAPLLLHIGDYVDRGAIPPACCERLLTGTPIQAFLWSIWSAITTRRCCTRCQAIARRRPIGCSPAAAPPCRATASILTRRARAGPNRYRLNISTSCADLR